MIRPPAIGAKLVRVDGSSVKRLSPARRWSEIKDFLAVVAEDEWTAVRAARALKAQWSEGPGCPPWTHLAHIAARGCRHHR